MNTAEISAALDQALNSSEFSPDTIIVPTGVYIELVVSVMDFGWWPLSILRRQGARKALRWWMDKQHVEEDEEERLVPDAIIGGINRESAPYWKGTGES